MENGVSLGRRCLVDLNRNTDNFLLCCRPTVLDPGLGLILLYCIFVPLHNHDESSFRFLSDFLVPRELIFKSRRSVG